MLAPGHRDASRSRACPEFAHTLLTAAAAAAVLAPAATAQAAPTTLAVEQAPTRVAAWDGVVMWSRFDPAAKTYSS